MIARRLDLWLRVVVGAVVTTCIGVTTLAFWIIGFGQYGEDLCLTAVDVPAGAGGSRGPIWVSPVSYECDFGSAGVVTTTDWFPLVGTFVGAGASLALVIATWWLLLHRRPGDALAADEAAVLPPRPPPMRSGS